MEEVSARALSLSSQIVDDTAEFPLPADVTPWLEIFAQSFSSGDGWSLEGCQGALGHTFCSWKRSNGHELRIGVINAVEGPYYVADQAQFT